MQDSHGRSTLALLLSSLAIISGAMSQSTAATGTAVKTTTKADTTTKAETTTKADSTSKPSGRTIKTRARVKPRLEHSINRYATGIQTITGSRFMPTIQTDHGSLNNRSTALHLEHLLLVGDDSKASSVEHSTDDSQSKEDDKSGEQQGTRTAQTSEDGSTSSTGPGQINSVEPSTGRAQGNPETRVERKLAEKTAPKTAAKSPAKTASHNPTKSTKVSQTVGSRYSGANGDSGGGGTQLGSINQSSPDMPAATGAQARAFWNVVRPAFKSWDVVPDGRLTLPELRHNLTNAQLKSDQAAALSALLSTINQTSSGAPAGNKFWSLAGLQHIVETTEKTNKSSLISKFVEHQQALQNKSALRLSLYGAGGKPVFSDVTAGQLDDRPFLAVVGALANARPQSVESLISAEGKGLYTVKFPDAPPQQVKLTLGDLAKFSLSGRNVVWFDVLDKAREQANQAIAAQAGLSPGQLEGRFSEPTILSFLTGHDCRSLDLSQQSVAGLKQAIGDNIQQHRLILLTAPNTASAVLSFDTADNSVKVWNPAGQISAAGAATATAASTNSNATVSVPLADLAKTYTSLTCETDSPASRNYQALLLKVPQTAADANAVDAALCELLAAGASDAIDDLAAKAEEATAADGEDRADKDVLLNLKHGSALIAHQQRVKVKTELGTISVAPSAVVYILSLPGKVAIYNLSDLRSGQVTAAVGNGAESLTVPVGEELLLTTDENADFDKSDIDKTIAHRNPRDCGPIGKIAAFRAEFSFTSMLDNAMGFQDLVASPRPSDRKVVQKLIKTAAIMLTLRPAFDQKPDTKKPADSQGDQAKSSDH